MKFQIPLPNKLSALKGRGIPPIGVPVLVLSTLAMVILPIPAFFY